MSCCECQNPFESTLHYSSPAHGGWGVVRMGHLMPESYQLFVSPAACGRHGAVSACMQGRKNRVSYLYLSEDDIVSGGYEDLLLEAVDELLDHLHKVRQVPRVLMIFVSCIDDLLGTDHDALIDQLSVKHAGIKFVFCHMNPTSLDTHVPPPVNIRDKLYSLLDATPERDQGVNLLGSLVPIHPESELFSLLGKMGAAPVRHITDYQTFDSFQQMARSRLNLVLAPPAKYAAENLYKKHGMPFHMALTSYDPEQVTRDYENLSRVLQSPLPQDVYALESARREEMEHTARMLGGMPVVIDGEAVLRPFELARALLLHGFSVKKMIVQQVIPSDRESYEWVRRNACDIQIIQPQHHRSSVLRNLLPECLAIGYNSGYITGSQHVVPSDGQTGHWGYHGIAQMMDEIRQAAACRRDLRELIAQAGLVV